MENELKTLQEMWEEKNKELKNKGITCACGNCDLVSFKKEELRSEAINWIKHYDKEGKPALEPDKTYVKYIQGWIMTFFNISEEDLT